MDKDENSITLLVPAEIDVEEYYQDKEGGVETGFKEQVRNLLSPKEIRLDKQKLQEGIRAATKNVATIIDDIKQVDLKEWEIDGIEIALGITASGTVGIVSAGVESSVTICFTRKASTRHHTNNSSVRKTIQKPTAGG